MRWVEMGGNVFGMGEYCFRMSSCGNMLRCYAPSKRTGMMISTDVLAATRLVHCQGLPLLQQPNVGRKSKASEHQVRSTVTKSDMLDVINLLTGTKEATHIMLLCRLHFAKGSHCCVAAKRR